MQLWARRLVNTIEDGSYHITTWDQFEMMMKTQFDSVNRKEDPQHNIMTFKQGNKTIEDFSQFEDYKADADFGEETIVFILKQNLNLGITSKVVFLPKQPQTYQEWKDAAWFFDRQYRDHLVHTKAASSTTTPAKPKPC